MTPVNSLILAAEPTRTAADAMDGIFAIAQWVGILVALIGALAAGASIVIARVSYSDEASRLAVPALTATMLGGAMSLVSWMMKPTGAGGGESGEQASTTTSTTQAPPPTQDAAPEPQNTAPDIDWSTLGLILGSIVGGLIVLVLLIVGIRAAWAASRRRREARETQRRAEREKLARWDMLDTRHNKVREAYVQAETDPMTVLERPIIRDVSHKLTQDFHTALSDATGALERRLDLDYATQAVDTLTRTWSDLWRTAAEVGLPGVSPGDRRRAHNLLTRILDESVDAPEREAARRRLDSIIESSELDRDTCTAVGTVVTQALELAGLPTLREITAAPTTDKDHP